MTTTARRVAQALAARGARHAFGMPGGETLPLLQALDDEGIRFILIRHEGSAGFAAAAAAQLSGAPGVCVSTLGPGATNLTTPLAGALLDRDPVVALTGEGPTGLRNVYTHQVLDQTGLLRHAVKHAVTLTAQEAWREVPLALRHLYTGRPGPVLLAMPQDVSVAPQPQRLVDTFTPAPALPAPEAVAAAAARLRAARRPFVLVGLGAMADAAAAPLRAVVEALDAPTLTTYKAKGALPASHPRCVGAFGLSSTADAVWQRALAEADLLLAIGLDPVELRPQWLPGWDAALPLVAVDTTPPLDLTHPLACCLVGDLPLTLRALAEALGPASGAEWPPDAVSGWRAAHDALFEEDGEAMGPAAAVRATQAGLPQDAIVTLDVGAHRITASQLWRCEAPNRLLQQNGLCSMGYGLPAAIAAKLTRPAATVAALIGDGGLWMTLGELGTAAELGLDLVIVYFSDQSLALIEEKQRRMRLPRLGVGFQNPEVTALARAFGAEGRRVTEPAALTAEVGAAVARGGLTLIEAVIDPRHYARQV